MADQKITQFTENTAPISTDILPMVDDPGGSPANNKVTVANLNIYKIVTSSTRPGSPATGWIIYETDTNLLLVYNSSGKWVEVYPKSAYVSTNESLGFAATTYTDLATSGPAVTVTTGTKAIVTVSTSLTNNVIDYTYMSYAVSGATTIAAADGVALQWAPPTAGWSHHSARVSYLTSLTAGSNTFTAKYRVAG